MDKQFRKFRFALEHQYVPGAHTADAIRRDLQRSLQQLSSRLPQTARKPILLKLGSDNAANMKVDSKNREFSIIDYFFYFH